MRARLRALQTVGESAPARSRGWPLHRILQKRLSGPVSFAWPQIGDCAHGAAYHIVPHVFHELGAEVIALGVQPDGFNINEGCGAIAPEMLAQAVREHRADFGIALDGDADRVQMADGAARLYNGDELLYVLAANWI